MREHSHVYFWPGSMRDEAVCRHCGLTRAQVRAKVDASAPEPRLKRIYPRRGDIISFPAKPQYIEGDRYEVVKVTDDWVHFYFEEPDTTGYGTTSIDGWHAMKERAVADWLEKYQVCGGLSHEPTASNRLGFAPAPPHGEHATEKESQAQSRGAHEESGISD